MRLLPVLLRLHTCGGDRMDACVTCECIERVTEYKYLGVIFDHRMKWAGHISYLKNKLRKFIFIFWNTNKILAPDLIKMIYYAYVQSLLQYGILAWGGCFQSFLSPLEITQKSIIKAALNKHWQYPTELLFDEFKVFNIRQLYLKTLVLYIHNNRQSLFHYTLHSYSTRYASNSGIIVPRLNKSINTTSSHYLANIIFPRLPINIKSPPQCNIRTIKKIIDRWLIELGREQIEYFFTSPYV
jgi:hypothetical protein